MKPQKAYVIGAGLAGLAAATTLASAVVSFPNVSADVRGCSAFAGQLYCAVGSETAFLGIVASGGVLPTPSPPPIDQATPPSAPSVFQQLPGWGALFDGPALSVWAFFIASWDAIWVTTENPAAQVALVSYTAATGAYSQTSAIFAPDPSVIFYSLAGRVEAGSWWASATALVLYAASPRSVW